MHVLLFLESIGTTELLVIAIVALIIFGPRRLPELGRSLGKSLGEFKRASDDFKRTWEREVEMDRVQQQERTERAMIDAPDDAATPTSERTIAPTTTLPLHKGEQIARGAAASDDALVTVPPVNVPEAPVPEPARKSDWL